MPARPRPRVMGKSFEASGQPLLETILEEASIMSSSRSTRVLSEYDRDDPPQLPIVPSNLAPPTSSLEANSSASSSSTTLTEFGERAGGNGTHYLSANTETQASSSNSTVTLTEVRVQRQSTAAPASPDSDRLYSKDISSKPVPPIPPITTISSSEFTILSSPATPTKTPSSGYGYNTNFQPNVSESSLTSKRDASRSSPPLPHSPIMSQPNLALANKPPSISVISQPTPEARYGPSTGPRGEMPMRQALLPQASSQRGKASALANGHSHHAREPADAPMRSTGIPPPSPPGLLRHSRSYDPYEVESLYTVAPIISHPHLHPPPPPPPPPLKS
ncbi:hypothetical protein BD410DRAFT_45853 [Rickenella mellea]|uniref:Uncharacterized protein n=1 Tax=Rickenella mellea TaxID=50990 RepID=A0A4R5XGH4_9AGAM|nr:hypothetical protein BD410DRAFT_45853 [Rickenella mellea]